jgi:predicted pyridoxine 5'-phosphate oxidase superfamily flavin-nucleotide-binding protein
MSHRFADIAFTQAVKQRQSQYGSRDSNDRLQELAGPNDRVGDRESKFLEQRDTFYMATVNESGWPYVQHRGGPKGFLRVITPSQLAFADFRGNTQLISTGNVDREDRCSLILVDYPNRKRLKIFGRVTVVAATDAPPDLVRRVALEDYSAKVERIFSIDVEAFDWNCPQHITRRYTLEEISELSGLSE